MIGFGGNWMGTNMQEIYERNTQIVKAQKEKAEQDKVTADIKCELCGRHGQEVWKLLGPFPAMVCTDPDNCDEYRKSISRPMMEI